LKKSGMPRKKLHTAAVVTTRSRSISGFSPGTPLFTLSVKLFELQSVLVELASNHKATIIPGYTPHAESAADTAGTSFPGLF